jgi:methylated-DNA-[protein]-cysteine S-methyltransferase
MRAGGAPMELCVKTPWNRHLRIVGDGEILLSSDFVAVSHPLRRSTDPLLSEAAAQVKAYIHGALPRFELPLLLRGTALQNDAWSCVAALEFGEFVSYADIARAIARPAAHRGVAAAMGATPFALFVPAHRVLGSDGRVRGATQSSMRIKLLEFERATIAKRKR